MAFTFSASANAAVDSPAVRNAGGEVLSLALIDARNHTLQVLSRYEQALGAGRFQVSMLPELNPPPVGDGSHRLVPGVVARP